MLERVLAASARMGGAAWASRIGLAAGRCDACVECQTSSDCHGATLVCDPSSETCVECESNGDCPQGSMCGATHTCTGSTSTASSSGGGTSTSTSSNAGGAGGAEPTGFVFAGGGCACATAGDERSDQPL